MIHGHCVGRVCFRRAGTHTEITSPSEEVHYFDFAVEPLCDHRGKFLSLLSSGIETTPWKHLIARCQEVLTEVRLLSGLLPICGMDAVSNMRSTLLGPRRLMRQAFRQLSFYSVSLNVSFREFGLTAGLTRHIYEKGIAGLADLLV
jgi:hypothetical protein